MNCEFCLFKSDKKRVIWEVTNYCNYNCKHCCASAKKIDKKDELDLEDFYRILSELNEFGVEEIYFSGGEPFSRKDILKILERARKYNILCNISTNGSLITENIAKKLKELNINKVHISVDSNEEKIFNEFRGGDYFNKTVEKIKLLKKHGIYVRVGSVIWKENVEHLEEMVNYMISLGVNEIVFNWLVKVGRLLENNDICVDVSKFNETIAIINNLKEKYKDKIIVSMHRNLKFDNNDKICPGGETLFYINPKGYISSCSWIKKIDDTLVSKDTLKNSSFFDIIKSNEISKFNQIKKERHNIYGAGCPAICKERNNTYLSKDPLLK